MGMHDDTPEQPKSAPRSNERDAFGSAGIGAEPVQSNTTGRRTVSGDMTAANVGNFIRRGFRANSGNAVVREFEKAFKEVSKETLEQTGEMQYGISKLDDSDSPDVPVGSVLLVGYFRDGSNTPTALVFNLAIAASAPSQLFKPFNDPNTQRNTNIAVPVSEFIQAAYGQLVTDKIQREYGADYNVILVGSSDVPRRLNPKLDPANADIDVVDELARLGFGAIDTYLENHFVDNPKFLTVEAITKRATTSVVLELAERPTKGANGLPIRRDMTLTLRSNVRSETEGMADRVVDVVQIGAVVNLLYDLPPPPVDRNQRADTRRLVPQILLTDIVPSREINIVTPETQVLGLAICGTLAIQDQWIAALLPMATDGNPFRDFGASGYEVNFTGQEGGQPAGREDMSQLSVAEQLEMVRAAVFTDRVHVALLVDNSSPYGFINAMFRDAADPKKPEAYDQVVAAANHLTGGVFNTLWERMGRPPISQVSDTVLHTGFYKDDSGDRDLLDIDYLYELNRFGGRNMDSVYRFGDTLLGKGDPLLRMQERWEIISQQVPSAVMTGLAQVVEINPDLIKAVTEACHIAGLNLRPSNQLVDFTGAAGRATYGGGMGRGLDARGITEALSSGYGQPTSRGGSSFFGGGFNRY